MTGTAVVVAAASLSLESTKEPLVGEPGSGEVTDVRAESRTPSVLADTKIGSVEVGFNPGREGKTMLYAFEMVSNPAGVD